MKDYAKKLFNLVDSIGETLTGDIHILENTERISCEGEKKYRVYHKDGYCFDVSKEVETEDDDTGKPLTFYYDFYAEWDGFDKIDEEKAIALIKKMKMH